MESLTDKPQLGSLRHYLLALGALVLIAVSNLITAHLVHRDGVIREFVPVPFDTMPYVRQVEFYRDSMMYYRREADRLHDKATKMMSDEKEHISERVTSVEGLTPTGVDSVLVSVHLHRADSIIRSLGGIDVPAWRWDLDADGSDD